MPCLRVDQSESRGFLLQHSQVQGLREYLALEGFMKLSKSSSELQERFKSVASGIPGAQQKKMFGYECFFINGNFAAGLWKNTAVFKLSEKDLATFLKIEGARPFAPMKGRVMKGWGEAPEALAASEAKLRTWCLKAAEQAGTLPPKAKKKAKAKKG
jgi:TfoX/Sxy family transcriptional regulator of competence genes